MTITASKARTLRARAARGATWLDEVWPGWWRRIRTTRLDMEAGRFVPEDPSDCGCIGAQLDATRTQWTGWYEDFLDHLDVSDYRETTYGFNVTHSDGGPPWRTEKYAVLTEAYDVLTEAWRDEVRARRKAAR